MRLSFLTATQALVATVAALPSTGTVRHAVLERRTEIAHADHFTKIGRLDPATVLPVSIALGQKNLHRGHDFLMEVSDPDSPKYGQHWTSFQIAQIFGSEPESVKAAYRWVIDAGIPKKGLKFSAIRSTLEFNATASALENLLHTKYWVYQDAVSGETHLGCDEYNVPANLVDHIDYITPTLLFGQRMSIVKKRSVAKKVTRTPQSTVAEGSKPDLSNCSASTTIDCIHALYNLPYASPDDVPHPNNSYAIAGLLFSSYRETDLDMFFERYFPPLVGKGPKLELINALSRNDNQFGFVETELDLMLSMPLSYPLNITFYQVGDRNTGGEIEYVMQAIDASYCHNGTIYEGDNVLHFPSPWPGGWNETDMCGTLPLPGVISTSYYSQENFATERFERRQCDEWLKLGLLGVTLLFCSGDRGVGGISNYCPRGQFPVSYPSSCPYVTSVGGTQLRPNSSISDGEVVLNDGFASGGGFSNIFDMPAYQRDALDKWWATKPENYTAAQFNTSRLSRGFPDLSATGHQIEVVNGGKFVQVYGTSASAPIIGAMIARINDARLKMGKGTVGFINPTIYKHPEIFHDITEGSNPGCDTDGFRAIEGWDPATGMGTPDFEKLRNVFTELP